MAYDYSCLPEGKYLRRLDEATHATEADDQAETTEPKEDDAC